jgi:uncharacterized protein YbaP (TraB family)
MRILFPVVAVLVRRVCLLMLFLAHFTALAAVRGGNAKIYRLTFKGHTSFIIGTDHSVSHEYMFPDSLLKLIKDVDKVVFESPFWLPHPSGHSNAEGSDSYFRSKASAEMLGISEDADRAFREIVGKDNLHNISDFYPGAAIYFALGQLDLRRKEARLAGGEELDKNRKSNSGILHSNLTKYPLSEPLRELVSWRIRDYIEPYEGAYFENEVDQALPNIYARELIYGKGVDPYIFKLAEGLEKNVSELEDTEPYRSDLDMYLNLLGTEELNEALPAMERALKKPPGEQWYNYKVAYYLSHAHSQRYLNKDNETLLKMNDLIEQEVGDLQWAGLEKVSHYVYSRHKFWVPRMLSEMSQGPRLFAVGASHVIGSPRFSDPDLIQLLMENGVEVSPVSDCQTFLMN